MEGSKLVNIDFSMAIQIINFLILVIFFQKTFTKKIGKVLDDRKKLALSEMKIVQEELEKLENKRKEVDKLRIEAKRRANDILLKSEQQADVRSEQIVSSAMMNRERMMMKAEADIEKMKQNAKHELEKEVGQMAIELAEKIIKENVKNREDEIIDHFIDQI